MENKVWFINAFWEVDYTDNEVTISALKECGNCFTSEVKAIDFLKRMTKCLE